MSGADTAGVPIRSDIVDVYIFRAADAGLVEFLQLRRTREPMRGAWHPVMGHMRPGETAIACAVREVGEEVGLDARSPEVLGFWQLEQVRPFFLAEANALQLSPRLALRVAPSWTPRLNDEHDAHRWVPFDAVEAQFVWPGQRDCCCEIASEIVERNGYAPLRI